MSKNHIIIKNASEHNLKNVSLSIPRNSFTVFTGVSGSGKSSLAYDTIFKEGQRRYLASLSSYARQFMQQMDKPDVDMIEGLSPTISIDQKSAGRNPRSTVGTITEIYDFMRLLYARLGTPHCPKGHGPISGQTSEVIVDHILRQFDQCKIFILSPMVIDRKGEYRKELQEWKDQGFRRIRVDGEIIELTSDIKLGRYEKHTLELALDFFTVDVSERSRLDEGVKRAIQMTAGRVGVYIKPAEKTTDDETKKLSSKEKIDSNYQMFSTNSSCPTCGTSISEIEPRLFSFNAPQGMCQNCKGLGVIQKIDGKKLVIHSGKSIFNGAIGVLNKDGNIIYTDFGRREIVQIAKKWKVDLELPWKSLPSGFQERIISGKSGAMDKIDFSLIENLDYLYKRYKMTLLERYMEQKQCKSCLGERINDEARHVLFRSENIASLCRKTIKGIEQYFEELKLNPTEVPIGEPILREIQERIRFLMQVGLEYLTLDRKANTLSGGEAQRIRLASQVGSGLEGCLYILDEPSIGLHQSDNKKLIQTLKNLRDKLNTVLVIEHDEDTMLSADRLVDVGPGAGILGGEIVFNDSPDSIFLPKNLNKNLSKTKGNHKNPELSDTVKFLLGKKCIETPKTRRKPVDEYIEIIGANKFNLKNVHLKIPLRVFTAVTGVSGSGKSTLTFDILKRYFQGKLSNKDEVKEIKVKGTVDRLIEIDQKAIGRTPRSNPVTYTKAMDVIRDLFATLPESKIRGYKKGRFSFNVKGGRCEDCGGAGVTQVDMQIFSSNEVECDACNGKRFNSNTLDIHYKGYNIYQILEMSVSDARELYKDIPQLFRIFDVMHQVGLGYIKLGQPSTTLSGGEAQRIKLVSELRKKQTGNTLYILDEPTTGLHFQDIQRLIEALDKLVSYGNSVIVIEHNLDVIKSADILIEMGPKGGEEGGKILSICTPEELAKTSTPTGIELKSFLNKDNQKAYFEANKARKGKRRNTGSIENSDILDKNIGPQINIAGLTKHNLKNISLTIPKNKLITVTGVSGSGKTSLAFETIFKEGQRKYIESLSTYARRFLGRMARAQADKITGISPTIAVDQKAGSKNPRSILATQTEIYDSFRVLYANIGHTHCIHCDAEITKRSVSQLADVILKKYPNQQISIYAPLYDGTIDHSFILDDPKKILSYRSVLSEKGFRRLKMNGELIRIDNEQSEKALKLNLSKNTKSPQQIDLMIDRVQIKLSEKSRVIESVEKALDIGEGILFVESDTLLKQGKQIKQGYSLFPTCFEHGYIFSDILTPKHFSFNHHLGACTRCQGIGKARSFNVDRFLTDPDKPLLKGAIAKSISVFFTRPGQFYGGLLKWALRKEGINFRTMPWKKLSKKQQDFVLYGSEKKLKTSDSSVAKMPGYKWMGMAAVVEKMYTQAESDRWRDAFASFITFLPCPECKSGRLDKRILAITVGNKNIAEVCQMTIEAGKSHFDLLEKEMTTLEKKMISEVLDEIKFRIKHLNDLGLHYLTLNRTMGTLSGGEVQRIRLSTQIGNKLNDVIYVLDEPTIGLHERDTMNLVTSLRELRDRGNTVICVEHDEGMIKNSDWIIDIGPGAGEHGGEVIYNGLSKKNKLIETSFYPYFYNDLKKKKNHSTIQQHIFLEKKYKWKNNAQLIFENVARNNISDLKVEIPLFGLVGICGVSGSGKSSLMDVVLERLKDVVNSHSNKPSRLKKGIIYELEKKKQPTLAINGVILVDQSPLSASKRSTIASYMEFFEMVRTVFALSKAAKLKGFDKGYFSYNSKKGQCPQCSGKGYEDIEMHFISDVSIVCDTCKGKRYRKVVLDIFLNKKNISDILELTVNEAYAFFESYSKLQNQLKLLMDTGLGYLKLGLSTNVLSGGERQRLKLCKELAKNSQQENNFYILDEPTTGLHVKDIHMLMGVLARLIEKGHSVVAIEHNKHFLSNCDYLIEMGPEAGPGGGKVVAKGTVEELIEEKVGLTWEYL